jgi:hypothetical protein
MAEFLEHRIRYLDEHQKKRSMIRSRSQWIVEGEENCKFYFDYLKRKHTSERKTRPVDPNGCPTEDFKEMMGSVPSAFSNIFKESSPSNEKSSARPKSWNFVPFWGTM